VTDEPRFFDYGLTFVRPVPMRRTKSTALLVIDMQYNDASVDQGFNLAVERISPGSMRHFNERNETIVIPAIRRLLDYFRSRGLSVIYLLLGSEYRDLRDVPARLRAWVRDVERRSGVEDIFWSGNPAFAVRKEIAPIEGETLIRKTTFGAFNSSNIDQVLQLIGVETLVITGISTNACVETTARDAADRGYACVLVEEGTADYDDEARDAALRGFHFNFGRVVRRAEDVIAALEAEADI
jgi:nicotinamidase-related amidase